MTTLKSMKLASLLLFLGVFLYSCETNPEMEKPSVSDISETGTAVASSTVANAYTVTFAGVSYNGSSSTWSYTVTRTGSDKGTGLSHMIFGLGSCAAYSNVTSASIDGVAYSSLSSTEGKGTGCTVPAGTNILKFDNLPANLSSGSHTFSFTLNLAVDVNSSNPVWVKGGKNQGCPSGSTVAGPGCYHVSGNISRTDCVNGETVTGPYSGMSVSIGNATVTTDASGNYSFSNLSGGNYTITAGNQSASASTAPASSDGNNFNFVMFSGVCQKVNPGCFQSSNETAMVGTSTIHPAGNAWFAYVDMTNVNSRTSDVWAGQYTDAGNVSIVRDGTDYLVTISIAAGTALQGGENWSIESYTNVPGGRPAPGQMQYKGEATSGTFTKRISSNGGNYIVIHLNVIIQVPVPCN
jgi:hypothetical protein